MIELLFKFFILMFLFAALLPLMPFIIVGTIIFVFARFLFAIIAVSWRLAVFIFIIGAILSLISMLF